jgi:hypothetical protein
MLTMKIRHQRFVAVLSHVIAAKPTNEVGAWDEITASIKKVSLESPPLGVHENVVRRDVITAFGYKGQADLVFDTLRALADRNARVFDQRINCAETVGKLDLLLQEPKVKTSREWLNAALGKGLHSRLVDMLARSFPAEDRNELSSMTNSCIASWCDKDGLKNVLRKFEHIPDNVLLGFVKKRMGNEFRKRGVDAHTRTVHNARTETERRKNCLLGVAKAENTAKTVFKNGDETDKEIEIVDQTENAEDLLCEIDLAETGSIILEALSPNGGIRRSQILRSVLNGASRQDLMREFDLAENRVNHLTSEIKSFLRDSETLLNNALKVATALKEEPWSSTDEISKDVGLSKKEVRAALHYMARKRLVVPSKDKTCYNLTLAGHNAEINLYA